MDNILDSTLKEDRQRMRGRKGIRTKATIKNNHWDREFMRGDYVLYGKDQVVYSLNKQGRWEEVEILKKEIRGSPPSAPPTQDEEQSEEKAGDQEGAEHTPDASAPEPPAARAVDPHMRLRPNPNHAAAQTEYTQVTEIKAHDSNVVSNLSSEPEGAARPRNRGGWWIVKRGGRDYARLAVLRCGECGNQIGHVAEPAADESENQKEDEETKEGHQQAEDEGAEDEEDDEEEEEEDEDEDEEGLEKEINDHRTSVPEAQWSFLPDPKPTKGEMAEATRQEEGRVLVQRAFKAGEYPLLRETRVQHDKPCMCCMYSMGPVWMMRGMGDKSKKKTKGFKKITRRDLQLHTE